MRCLEYSNGKITACLPVEALSRAFEPKYYLEPSNGSTTSDSNGIITSRTPRESLPEDILKHHLERSNGIITSSLLMEALPCDSLASSSIPRESSPRAVLLKHYLEHPDRITTSSLLWKHYLEILRNHYLGHSRGIITGSLLIGALPRAF